MIKFKSWVKEAKTVPTPPTVVSAPLRGQNQDQSGYNGKNDVTDYTISDDKKMSKKKEIDELSKATIKSYKEKSSMPKPNEPPRQSLNRLVGMARAFRRLGIKEGVISAVTPSRITPIEMDGVKGKKSANAPSSSNNLQRIADKRREQLDKQAQDETERQKTEREKEIKRRQNAADSRQQ
jgi:hypothetical protein